jgi:hypothetical protein
MKVIQNGLGKGGAFKVRKNPCHICDIKDDDIDAPNKTVCGRWCRKWQLNSERHSSSDGEQNAEIDILPGIWSGKCYHMEWLSQEAQQMLLEDIVVQDKVIESYLGGVDNMEVIRLQLLINVNKDPRGEGSGNSCNDINSSIYNFKLS